MGPVHAAAHIHLTLVEFQQVRTAVLDLGQGEVRVILGVVHNLVRSVGKLQDTLRGGHGRAGAIEVHVQPVAVALAVLDLSSHGILLRVDAESAGQGYKEDIAGAGIRRAMIEYAERRHWDGPGLGVVMDGNVVPDPIHDILRRLQVGRRT